MGITIHYCGTVDDLNRIDELEDRVVDLVFALGGRATVWRSFAEHNPQRVVRGVLVDIAPGHDTFSLLISPEGHLTPLFQINAAEDAPSPEPPACFVKTQFGSLQGHIAIVHLLDSLRQGYCSNLKVTDEGEYYETRDVTRLTEKRRLLNVAIESLADGLRDYGLSPEAAEDPGIMALRVERIAKLVQQKLLGDNADASQVGAESAVGDVEIDGDRGSAWDELSLEEEVSVTERARRDNLLRGERMNRRIQEATASGLSIAEAFRLAMRDEGLDVPQEEADLHEADVEESSGLDEPSRESLREQSFGDREGDEFIARRESHPAVEQAQTLLLDLMGLSREHDTAGEHVSVACRGATDLVGGLVQATSCELQTRTDRALAITQLKRALAGHAFARGAVFALQNSGQLSRPEAGRLHDQLAKLLAQIHDLTSNAWDESVIQ